MCTLRPRGRRIRKITPGGVYSQKDWLHQRSAHQCFLRGEDAGVGVRGDLWLLISTDRPTAWMRGRVARRMSAAFGSQVTQEDHAVCASCVMGDFA